jgi:hypothetical protein
MERRFPHYAKIPASERTACSRQGERMEPKSPIKSSDTPETLLPSVLCPVDADDYFELAYETDEFGVHVPDYLVDR